MADLGAGRSQRVTGHAFRESSCRQQGPAPLRSVGRAALRAGMVAAILGIGSGVVVLLTAIPGYGRTGRGMIALQQLSRLMLRAMGIRVLSRGGPRSGASLVVANHASWIDVVVLTAAAPMLPVVRDDVSKWLLVGPLLSRIGALFVRANRCRDLPPVVEQMTAALRRGHRVQVFPAGRPGGPPDHFRRAVFQAAVDAAVVISPVALSYRGAGGRSVALAGAPPAMGDDLVAGLSNRHSFARQVTLEFRTVWRTLRSGPLTVQVDWLPVIPALAGPGHPAQHRAKAARRTERAIARALGQSQPQQWVARHAAGHSATGSPFRVPPTRDLAPALAGSRVTGTPLVGTPSVRTQLVGTQSVSAPLVSSRLTVVADVPKVA